VASFALPGQCSGVTRVISAAVPYRLDTPLSFVLWCPWIWHAGHGHGEANKRSTDSKSGVTGDNYPAHNRPIVGQSLVLILGSREIPFPGSRKRSRLPNLVTSLVQMSTQKLI